MAKGRQKVGLYGYYALIFNECAKIISMNVNSCFDECEFRGMTIIMTYKPGD